MSQNFSDTQDKTFSILEVYCSQGVQHSSSTKDKQCSSLCDSVGFWCGLENVTNVSADMRIHDEFVTFQSWFSAIPLILNIQVGTGERVEWCKLMLRLKAWCWRSPTRKYEEERRGGGLLCGHMLHNHNLAVGRKNRRKKNVCRNESQDICWQISKIASPSFV